ncbi:MAG: helix-turn-helix transcriptional regulator [Bacteroidota bacterium]
MYQEIQASKPLSGIIDAFWTYSNNPTDERFKVLPDTCADFIFDLQRNQAFVSGVMTRFQCRELSKGTQLLGIRFKAEQVKSLIKVPLCELTNRRIELSEVSLIWNASRRDQLLEAESISKQIRFLDNWLSTAFEQVDQPQDSLVRSIATGIRQSKGRIKVKEIAASNFISLRQLQRRFKKQLGLTVKEFTSLVRFTQAQKIISSRPSESLSTIAFEAGYFDQAHMTKTFQQIAGETPSAFR